MKRRTFIAALGGAAAWPVVGRAQQQKSWRIGIITIQQRTSPPYSAFDQRLRELGYSEGQNLSIEFVNPDMQAGGIAGGIDELVRRKVDVITDKHPAAVHNQEPVVIHSDGAEERLANAVEVDRDRAGVASLDQLIYRVARLLACQVALPELCRFAVRDKRDIRDICHACHGWRSGVSVTVVTKA